jgi:oxalate decarboxylase/phosphoglucose isomerase-like protein (cupin superfamily)
VSFFGLIILDKPITMDKELIRENPTKKYFERSWGRAIEFQLQIEPDVFDLCIEKIDPGKTLKRHYHPKESGIIQHEVVLKGDGWILTKKKKIRVRNGKIKEQRTGFIWDPETIHGYKADLHGPGLRVLTISQPAWQPRDDIFIE